MCLGAIYWSHLNKIYFGNTKNDAKNIGFDDAFIYDEIMIPIEKRHLPTIQILPDKAIEAFVKWENKDDKIEY